jgi:asparagine synthase (glutamine-hydrolysing)
MAHGLETRVPFLDNDLVDFALKTPVKLKLKNPTEFARLNENEPGPKAAKYFQKTNNGKLILRTVMERYIPRDITNGIKRGFSAPDATWFKGDSIDFVKRTLFNRQALIYDLIDQDTVETLVQEHLSGKQNRRLLIWSLLNIEDWLKCYISSYQT